MLRGAPSVRETGGGETYPEVDRVGEDGPDDGEVDEGGDAVGDGEARVEPPHVLADIVVRVLCVCRSLEAVALVHDALHTPVSRNGPHGHAQESRGGTDSRSSRARRRRG